MKSGRNLRRNLEESEEQCTTLKKVQTPLNTILGVPSYAGIMFDVFSGGAELDVLTMEFDVHLSDVNNMGVKVYTKEGNFKQAIGNQSAWELVADTTLVTAPEGGGGVIVPFQDFTTIRMQPRERRSFYISMMEKVINSPAMALQKTGDFAHKGDDMDFFVGVGFNENGFPAEADTVVDPQFAGVIHYERKESCRASVTNTFARFHFLSEGFQQDDTLAAQMNAGLTAALQRIFSSDSILQGYVNDYSLQITGDPRVISSPFQGK